MIALKSQNLNYKTLFYSPQDEVYVFEVQNGTKTFRLLSFEEDIHAFSKQSIIYTKTPEKIVSKYVKMMLYAISYNSNPKKVLMLGMGAGIISSKIATYFSRTIIDIVEINPIVPKIAKEYFGFIKTANINIFIEDGYSFAMNLQPSSYDLIFIDVFDNNYIPPQFLQDIFFKQIKKILTENGIVAFNTFFSSKTYKEEEELILSNFPFVLEAKDANRIIFASKSELKNHKIPYDLGKQIDFKKISPQRIEK